MTHATSFGTPSRLPPYFKPLHYSLLTATRRAAQLEKLESKIEHLVNALSTAQNGGQVSPPHSRHRDSDPRVRNRTSEVLDSMCEDFDRSLPDASQSISRQMSGADSIDTTASDHMMSPEEKAQLEVLGVTMSEAEVLLDRFRRLMAPLMPFVVLPSEISAAQLYTQEPFLLHAIITVTYFHDLSKQQILVKHLMRDVSQRILLDNEKTVGILQGLLVSVLWPTSVAGLLLTRSGLRRLVSHPRILGSAGDQPPSLGYRHDHRPRH